MKISFKNKIRMATAVALLTPSLAFATNGYFAHGWGMKSKAMAGAGIANAEDGLSAANNPAGMVHVGNRVDFGIDWFSPDRESNITGTAGAVADQSLDGNGTDNFLIPEFGYNQMLGADRSIGVAVYGNGGMNTNYEGGVILFNGGAGPNRTGVDLSQLFVAPTYSMKINNAHSFGVSVNLAFQRFQAEGLQGFCNGSFSSNPTNCTNNGYSTSTGYGLTLGWLGQLAPNVSMGATYRSQTYMSEFDEYAGLFAEQGDFDIPSMYGVGFKFTPSSDVTILFDYTHINYSDIASIANPISNLTVGGNALGTDNGGGFGWKDMDVYKLAIAWQMRPDLVLRAGWNHGEQPIPTNETLFNVLAPATVEDHLTLGATWTLANKAELTVAYMHAFENTVNGSGSIPLGGGFPGGEANIGMSQNSLGVAYGWKF